jgi:hypothetical protein
MLNWLEPNIQSLACVTAKHQDHVRRRRSPIVSIPPWRFAECPGGHLFRMKLGCRPEIRARCPEGDVLRDGNLRALLAVVPTLMSVKEVAYHEWENRLITEGLPRNDLFFKVIQHWVTQRDNGLFGACGPTGILQHELDGVVFYTLYGHLSRESLMEKESGARSCCCRPEPCLSRR